VPSLSGFEQTFIDNLNGKNIMISDILNRNLIELYNNKALINLNEFFQNELYNCFKKIDYTFDDKSIKESEYIGNVINYILSDEKLKKKITDIILKGIEKYKKNEKNKEKNNEHNKNQTEKKSWNIYDYIFENEISEKNEDFISIFISTLEKVFISFLSIFLIEAEKSSIFSSFIYKKNLPENVKSMWESKLDEINFSDKVVIEFKNILKQTNIKINTKMNLPSFEFIKSLKNLLQKDNIKEYFEAENEIRNCREPGDFIKDNEDDMENEEYEDNEEIKEKKKLINEFFYENVNDINDEKYESVKEDINKFYVPNNKLVNDIKQFIDKDEFVKKLKKINDINLLKLFIEDYYSCFFNLITSEKRSIFLDVIYYLIEMRFESFENYKSIDDKLIYFSKSIIWCQIYKGEFEFLLKNIEIISTYHPDINIIEKIKSKINSKEVDYIISNHNPRHKQLINKPFLLILDSLFFNLIEIIEVSKPEEVLNKMEHYFEIIQNAEIINSNLKLKSKDFYRFKTLYNIIKILDDSKSYNKNDINKFINYIKYERKMILENKEKEISESISEQINFLIKIIPECEEKLKTIMKILISKYKEITNLDCRNNLCDIILDKKNSKFLKLSNEFFIYILDLFDFSPESLKEDEDISNPFSESVKNNKNYSLLMKINDNFCKILSENFEYIFKYKISNYYKNEIKRKEIEKENEKIEETKKVEKIEKERKKGTNEILTSEEKIKIEIESYFGESSQTFFKNCYNTLIKIQKGYDEYIINKNIKKVFCVVYCNMFLENFVKYCVEQPTYFSTERNKIIKFLTKGNDKIRKSFKLIILKELKSKYILERTEFLNIKKWRELYYLKDLFPDLKFKKENSKELHGSLDIPFYSGDNLLDFLKEKEERVFRFENLNNKQFIYNIDLFINENLSTLKTEEGYNACKNSKLMNKFLKYVNESKTYTNGTKKLIQLFFDTNIYNKQLLNIVKETEYFDLILYAYKFSILCSLANPNSIYNKMLNVNSIKEISNAYIPGADLYCDLWVESYMNMKDVINYISVGPSGGGFYICDCGEYYFQVPCGVPLDISKCANCGKEIGGKNQKLVIRKEDNGEYKIMRIYSNENNRRAVQSRPDLKRIYGNNFERGYPYKIFSKFKEEILVKLQKEYKGISEQSFLFFITEKDIRNLNNISFRLLNFIIYSNIYFAYKCGIISLNDIKINKLVPIKENKYKGKYNGDECYYNGYRKEILDKRRDLNDKNVENAIIYILNVN